MTSLFSSACRKAALIGGAAVVATGLPVTSSALAASVTAGPDFICPANNVCFFTGIDWNGTVTVIPGSKFPLDTEENLRSLEVTVPWGSVTNKLTNCLQFWSAQDQSNLTKLGPGERETGVGATGDEGRGKSYKCYLHTAGYARADARPPPQPAPQR